MHAHTNTATRSATKLLPLKMGIYNLHIIIRHCSLVSDSVVCICKISNIEPSSSSVQPPLAEADYRQSEEIEKCR